MYLSIDLSIDLSIYLSIYLSICLSICLSASVKTKLFWETSSVFELDNIKTAAIQRDFLNFCTWQRQKRSNSVRLPDFCKLTTSKNEAILRDFLQKWKVECRADSLVPMRFAIFRFHLSKLLRLPRKTDTRSYEVLHLSCKIISANLKIWCSKMQSLSRNQRPDLLTALMNMSLVLRLPRKMHLCRSSSNVPRLPSFLEMLQNPHVLLTFDKMHNPVCLPRETASERQKVLRPPQFFALWTSKCASRYNGVHFFNISTSKSGPKLVCFDVFCTFWLRNVLRATTACTFSTSQLPKVVQSWCALYILTWKCASCHDGVQFFISHLASCLRTRRFSEPTFRQSNHWKNTVFHDFPTFSRICIFFLLTLSLLIFFLLIFLFSDSSHLCFSFAILSEVWLLNFLR